MLFIIVYFSLNKIKKNIINLDILNLFPKINKFKIIKIYYNNIQNLLLLEINKSLIYLITKIYILLKIKKKFIKNYNLDLYLTRILK